jgi:tetratricopeptide (TPR) repeat protein
MYPMLSVVPVLFVIVAVISLVSVTAFIVSRAGQKGYLLVGWLWFLLLLLPVIGLVQIREQPIADRSLYAPMIGLGIMLAWTARDLITQRPGHARLLGGIGAAAVLACAVASFFQLKHWETSLSLFSHAVKVTQNNVPALTQLGNALASAGRVAEGRAAVAASARISPNRVESMLVAASICQQENQLQQAVNFYTGAINLRPESAETHLAVGTFLDQVSTNKTGALYHLSQAVKLRPEYPEALNNLAWMLATAPDYKIRNGKEAVRLAREACTLTGYRIPALIGTLAACHAEAGKFPQAVSAAKQAIDLAEKQGFKALADQNRKLLELYQAEKTVRQPPLGAQ